LYIGCSTCREN